ncbi:hypothetical protein AZF37_03175 [endosymbiont 'TC1' of Trimyema compressum]|nr:hypothetical protein AZF37_03175 [endosymbiont 'TC1' of Trimyema compressum]
MYQIRSYQEATTLDEAVKLLSGNDSARIIAGGTDVLIKTRERKRGYIDRDLVGIMRIHDLKGVRIDNEGTIFIGATTTFTEVENSHLVKQYLGSLSFACCWHCRWTTGKECRYYWWQCLQRAYLWRQCINSLCI